MRSQHKKILRMYSPWLYTLVGFAATALPFFVSGPPQLKWMKLCGPVALSFGLAGFYLCFRSRHPRLRDLAIWMNLAAIGLGATYFYLGYA